MPAPIGGYVEKAGEAAGAMIPGVAAMAVAPEAVGPAAALGLASGAMTGVERYQQLREEGHGPFGAAARALPAAAVSGATGYAMGRFGSATPFKGAPANVATQVAGQGAISAGGQVGMNVVEGNPTLDNVGEAAATGAAMALPITAAVHGAEPIVNAARSGREAVFQSEAAGKPAGKVLAPILRATLPDSGAPSVVRTLKNQKAGRAFADAAVRDKAFTENMKVFGTLNDAEQVQAFDYLTGQGPAGALSPDVVTQLDAARSSIDTLSMRVVNDVLGGGGVARQVHTPRAGLQQTIIGNLGEYVKRFYRSHHEAGWLDKVKGTQEYNDAVNLYVSQGLTPDQAAGAVQAKLNAHGMEDTSTFDASGRSIPQSSFIRRKNIPPEIRAVMGEVKDPSVVINETTRSMDAVLSQHKYLSDLAAATDHKGASLFSDAPSEAGRMTWRMPETEGMGPLSGKYTTRETYEAVMDAPKAGHVGGFADLLDKHISKPFRWAKTVGNPATHSRNIIGDTAMAEGANVSVFNPRNAQDYARAGGAIRNKAGADFREFAESGAAGSQLFDNPGVERDLATSFALRKGGVVGKAKQATSAVKDKATSIYNSEDLIFRAASYFKRRRLGDSPQQAAEWTNKFFPDYDANPVLVKEFVKWPFAGPFLQFVAQVPRIVGNMALHNPAKMATVVAGYKAFTGGALLPAEKRDDWNEARKLLPDYGKGSVPFIQDGKLYTINVQNMLPGASGLEGVGIGARDLLGGGPAGEAFQLAMFGQNAFGRKVLPDNATPLETAGTIGKELLSSQIPTPLDVLDPYSTGSKLLASGKPDKYGKTTSTGAAALNMATGVNPQVLDFDQLRYGQYFSARRSLDQRLEPLATIIESPTSTPEERIAARNEVRALYKDFGDGIKEQAKAFSAARRIGAGMGMPLKKNMQVAKDMKSARSRVRNLLGLAK